MYNREMQEAIDAGESALRSLKEARESLGSARGWGLLDIFGGGTISGLVKHMKVTDARNSLDKAKAGSVRNWPTYRIYRGWTFRLVIF